VAKAVFKITGEIKDFTRVDNVFAAMKREAEKGLDPWKIEVMIEFEATGGKGEIP